MSPGQAELIARDILDVGHFLFDGASWEFYEHVLSWRDNAGHHARITYDCGQMEMLTGADVSGALCDVLPKVLAAFSFDEGVSPSLAGDLTPAEDVAYVISGRVGRGTIKFDLTRSRFLDNNGGLQPGPLRLKGLVRAEGGTDYDVPAIVVFPGLDPDSLKIFIEPKKQDKSKP
jgi:hypothetical protein